MYINKYSFLEGDSLDMLDNYNYEPGYNASGIIDDIAKSHPRVGDNLGFSNMDIDFIDDNLGIKQNKRDEHIKRMKKLRNILDK
jgi:hypothetical protein